VALSLHLARAVARDDSISVAMVGGSAAPIAMGGPMQLVSLPALKEPLHDAAAIELLKERGDRILEFFREWKPSCVIVDQIPLGIGGELIPTLETARREEWKTRFALGVSYIEGLPKTRERNPHRLSAYAAYSIAIGYQDRRFEPVLDHLRFLPALQCANYLGIAAPVPMAHVAREVGDLRKRVVVLCGGGYYQTPAFINVVINACRPLLLDKKIRLTCVVGPLAGKIRLQSRNRKLPEVAIRREGRAEECMAYADVIVARCGYNTAFTAIQGQAPVVFVPTPGQESEQINRAKKLAMLDRVWAVEENGEYTVETLAAAIDAAVDSPFMPRPLPFTTNGGDRLAAFLHDVL
jgi:predicted glycosyltransferase